MIVQERSTHGTPHGAATSRWRGPGWYRAALYMVIATFLLMALVFGSVILPAKAVIMNVLGIGATLGFLTAVGPISTDMYLPAFPALEASLRTPQGSAQITLATWFVGLAVGQLTQGSLSDRFGLWIGFHNCDQPTYFAMVEGYAKALGLPMEREALLARAKEWTITRGSRSGRVAWQFALDMAGELGVKVQA